jgi:hypothetical protein
MGSNQAMLPNKPRGVPRVSMAAQIRKRTVANPGDVHFSSVIASQMRTSSFS